MGKKNIDLTVDGPGTPISIKKFTAVHNKELKELSVLVDNTAQGFIFDDPNILYMTVDDRALQAKWYAEELFDGEKVPLYLYRYLHYMFIDGSMKYPTDADLRDAFINGDITDQSEDYKQIVNMIKYHASNKAAAQMIGFIMLFAGTLKDSVKRGMNIRMMIQEPETHLHPQQEARFMSLFYKLREEYGPAEEEEEIEE